MHPTTPASPGPHRRRPSSRRLQPEGEGESSREASAESNDETTTSGAASDNEEGGVIRPGLNRDLSSSFDIDPRAARQGVTGGIGNISLDGPGSGSGGGFKRKNIGGAGIGLGGGLGDTSTEGEGGSASGHDGDISSAPAPSSSLGARLTQNQPHQSRAPIHHNSEQQTSSPPLESEVREGEEADNEMVPSETEGEVAGRGGGQQARTTATGEELWAAAPKGFLSNLSAQEIQEHIRSAVAGQTGRAYKINPPPVGRPVRIYADGVYDLLHYGHMLQLRQCKLAFPSVHLLVGCCSSELVHKHKAQPVMHSEERYESLRHVKWVDEVVEDAPWTVDQEFIDKWEIDYVAHDEEPYVSAGSDDVYAFAKSIGAFLPTKRTGGVSTSEVLQRIVEGYREGDYDGKLRKIGHPELCSRQGSEAGFSGSVRKD
ncbi:hypothetical protein JCM5353_000345 [Sporobolomyces roseus]